MTDILAELNRAVLEGDDTLSQELAQKSLDEGHPALTVLNEAIVAGLQAAGDLWQKNEYFLPDMVMSAEAFRAAMEVVEPQLSGVERGSRGKYLIGTVAGDMHDLGKMMVVAMLRGAGFQVIDLGEDVPEATFIGKVMELKPDILGLGCYMTTTMVEMEKVIRTLSDCGLRQEVAVMIGGVPTSQKYADEIGADAWGKDALDAVEKARTLLKGR